MKAIHDKGPKWIVFDTVHCTVYSPVYNTVYGKQLCTVLCTVLCTFLCRVMKAINEAEPNWIIFVEGMYHGPYWWGGNVMKLLEAEIEGPVRYSDSDRISVAVSKQCSWRASITAPTGGGPVRHSDSGASSVTVSNIMKIGEA